MRGRRIIDVIEPGRDGRRAEHLILILQAARNTSRRAFFLIIPITQRDAVYRCSLASTAALAGELFHLVRVHVHVLLLTW
jgi:hypothetical protein